MLTHRERVIKALNHEEPDRVPIDLYFHAGMLTDKAYFQLKDYLGLKEDIAPFRQGLNANYYDERLLEIFDIDFRRIFFDPYHDLEPMAGSTEEESIFVDAWGTKYVTSPSYVHPVGPPLAGIDTIEGLRDYPWPRPEQFGVVTGMKEEAERLFYQTDYAISLRRPGIRGGLVDQGGNLRGMEQFMMDMALTPDYVRTLMETLAEIYAGVYALCLDLVGPYVQMVETQDDLGAQNNPLISPKMWRDLVKPAQKHIFDTIREKAPQAKIAFHTDGNVWSMIPDLIEIGVDVLNPIQPSAREMDSFRLKETFGDRLCFHGAMDVQQVLIKDEETVRRDVRTRIDALGPGGGFIVAPCNHIQHDVAPQNVVAMYEETRTYGCYPLPSSRRAAS
jgi:uroporphyrinogen decarboxylase